MTDMTLVVGLTGSIGSGKSTVANLFAKHGVPIIDADVIARGITQPGTRAYKAITNRFGQEILKDDHTIDRASLREIIFSRPEERKWLEALLHPEILAEMQANIANLNTDYCLAVIPLLLETEAASFVQRVLVVDIPEDIQLERASLRDNSTKGNIKAIIDTQIDRKLRLAQADDIINNAGSPAELAKQVDQLHQQYLKLARN